MNDLSAKQISLNALCTGAVAGALTYYFLGEDSVVDYFGFALSAPVAVAAAGAVGSVSSDLFAEKVIAKLGMTNQFVNGSTIAVQAGVGGVASALALYLGGAPVDGLVGAVVIGSVAKLGGNYANEKLFDPIHGIIDIGI